MSEHNPWPHLHRRAAAHLSGDLADRVLRQHRLTQVAPREAWQSLGWAALAAATCAVLVVTIGQRYAAEEEARNYAAWTEVAAQTSLLSRLP